MTLSPQWLDELRQRTSMSALIQSAVKLTKAGREFKGCCPFHQEKTPSFYVNDEKMMYHCFGCGAHGDAIRWMTDYRGLPFMDAVKQLAEAAGLDVPERDPQSAARAERQSGLYPVMSAAQAWFAEQLWGIEGAEGRDALSKRGISPEFARKMGFGWAPRDRARMRKALDAFGDAALIEAGLLISVEGRDPYDRFRGRLMFPIRDIRARVIAFGGRIVGDGEPKYLNSPQTPLFDKGRSLFNVEHASPASRRTSRLLVVEGYMDVYALMEVGIEEAVATNGTAMTETQMVAAWRMADCPTLCFDGDSAGRKAAAKAAIRALPGLQPGKSLNFAFPPTGQDPDDVARRGGREAVEKMASSTVSLVQMVWDFERAAASVETPEQRAAFKARLREHCAAICDASVREEYHTEFRQRLDGLFGARGSAAAPRSNGKSANAGLSNEARSIAKSGIGAQLERTIVAGLAVNPSVLKSRFESVGMMLIDDPECAQARDALVARIMEGLDAPALDIAKELIRKPHLPMRFLSSLGRDGASELESLLDAKARAL